LLILLRDSQYIRAFINLNDYSSYFLSYLWHYGVSEGFKSVHPSGNPIQYSQSVGVGISPLCNISCDQFIDPSVPCLEILRGLPLRKIKVRFNGSSASSGISAVGVADNEKSIPPMGRADATSWNNKRPCGVALIFQ